MASIKIVLYTQKILANGEHPIMLRIIKDRKPTYLSIGKSCSKILWDFKENAPKKKHPFKHELDMLLAKKIREASKIILDFENEERYFSGEAIRNKLQKTFSKISVYQFFDVEIERLTKANRIGYARVFKDTKRELMRFRGGKDFQFADVNVKFLNDFEAQFAERGVANNSISVFMRTLRKLINSAITEGYCPAEIYPFKAYNISKLTSPTIKRALTKEQMKKIIATEVTPGSSLFHSKNYFLFSFYNRGMNFTDLAFLKWSDIRDERLHYVRKKTGQHYNIELLPPSKEILEYYQSDTRGEFVFPILNEGHRTAISIHNRTKKMLRQTNQDLKEIAKMADINVPVTTYVARHSWGTILKRNGISTSIISEGYGHTTERTTQIYLDSFENQTLDEANRALL